MLVENSIVVANFIKGLFVPMGVLTGVTGVVAFILLIYAGCSEKPKVLYWEIPIGIFLLFAIWFFSTFSLR